MSEYNVDFIKTLAEYDEIIKANEGKEITGEYEHALLLREFVSKADYEILRMYGALNKENNDTLRWLMTDIDNIRYYILGGAPSGSYFNSLTELTKLYTAYKDDFNDQSQISEEGIRRLHSRRPNESTTKGDLYKRMAISLSLTHSARVGLWMQSSVAVNQSNSVVRYKLYKDMYNNGNFRAAANADITPWFESYTIEEMRFVLQTNIDDEEVLWLNEYTQSKINANPKNVWSLLTPHSYVAYVWPNYQDPRYYADENFDYFNDLFSVPKQMKMEMHIKNICGKIQKIQMQKIMELQEEL